MDAETLEKLRALPKFSDEWVATYRSALAAEPDCSRCHGIRWVHVPGIRWRQLCPDCMAARRV